MKAISVKQPYAGWILQGVKKIETRTWITRFTNNQDILIVSSIRKHPDFAGRKFQHPDHNYYGYALCVVKIVQCRPMTVKDEPAACCNMYPGAWSWVLSDVRRIQPFQIKGIERFFEVDDSLIKYL